MPACCPSCRRCPHCCCPSWRAPSTSTPPSGGRRPGPARPSPVHPLSLPSSPSLSPFPTTELDSTLQALFTSFLPRASSLTSDCRCPLCSHPIDLEADQLTADSALIYLAHDADTTPHDSLPPTLPTDLPQPVPSPVLTLSTMSDSGGGKGIRAGEEAVEQAASTATVTGMGVLGSSTAAPGAALPVGVQARGLLLPPPSSLQSASSDGDGDERGVSCHQCKSNKPKSQLLFCTTKSNPEGKKRRCRKKYCTTHSARTHTLHTAFSLLPFPPPSPSLTSPPLPTLSSPCLIAHLSTSSPFCSPSGDACLRRSYSQCISAMSADELLRWQCPSCASSCTCAACLRRGSRSSDSFTSPSSSTPASASTTPSHTPTPSQSSSTVASPSQRQPHLSSTPSSTPPIPLPPPNLLQSHFPLAMSGLPTPTRTHLPVSYPSPFHPFHHFSSHPPSPFHHPPPYLPPNPFGGYQFAVSPQFVMSGVAGGGRGGGVDMGGMGGMGGFKGGGGLVVTGLRNGYGAGASAAAVATPLTLEEACKMFHFAVEVSYVTRDDYAPTVEDVAAAFRRGEITHVIHVYARVSNVWQRLGSTRRRYGSAATSCRTTSRRRRSTRPSVGSSCGRRVSAHPPPAGRPSPYWAVCSPRDRTHAQLRADRVAWELKRFGRRVRASASSANSSSSRSNSGFLAVDVFIRKALAVGMRVV